MILRYIAYSLCNCWARLTAWWHDTCYPPNCWARLTAWWHDKRVIHWTAGQGWLHGDKCMGPHGTITSLKPSYCRCCTHSESVSSWSASVSRTIKISTWRHSIVMLSWGMVLTPWLFCIWSIVWAWKNSHNTLKLQWWKIRAIVLS